MKCVLKKKLSALECFSSPTDWCLTSKVWFKIYINELCYCMDSLSEAPFAATLASNGLRDAVCPLL